MNENINLCEILKGHEGETFYCSLIGKDVQLYKAVNKIIVIQNIDELISFCSNGAYREDGEMQLFPSKDQRDWSKWIEEQKSKTPKTWSELVIKKDYFLEYKDSTRNNFDYEIINPAPIEKSALVLLKIHQLIEVGYGGNVSNDDWNYDEWKYVIGCYSDTKEFKIVNTYHYKSLIAFHTKLQAEEFLSHPENVQLLKDYFMI